MKEMLEKLEPQAASLWSKVGGNNDPIAASVAVGQLSLAISAKRIADHLDVIHYMRGAGGSA